MASTLQDLTGSQGMKDCEEFSLQKLSLSNKEQYIKGECAPERQQINTWL